MRSVANSDEPSSAFTVALRRAMDESGMSAAQLARAADVPPSTLRTQLDEGRAPEPKDVFCYEDVLGLDPGELSRHLGYLPVGAASRVSVRDAIAGDPSLSTEDKELLLAVYRLRSKRQRPRSARSSS